MRLLLYSLISSCCLCFSLNAQAQSVLVVTDKAHPVTNLPEQVRMIELDAAQNLQEQLSTNLPDNQQQAQAIVRERLAFAGVPFQEIMQEALQGIIDAWALGVVKVPAVIIDGYVVYGETDVNQAVIKIQSYQERGK